MMTTESTQIPSNMSDANFVRSSNETVKSYTERKANMQLETDETFCKKLNELTGQVVIKTYTQRSSVRNDYKGRAKQ